MTIALGGLLAWASGRRHSDDESRGRGHEKGVLLASGLIAGEAIAGVLIAIPKASKIALPDLEVAFTPLLTAAAIMAVAVMMYRASASKS